MKFTLSRRRTSLCEDCLHGMVTRFATGETQTICSEQHPSFGVKGPVSECSAYDYRWGRTDWEMDKVAFILERNKKGEVIGFRPPKKEKGTPE